MLRNSNRSPRRKANTNKKPNAGYKPSTAKQMNDAHNKRTRGTAK